MSARADDADGEERAPGASARGGPRRCGPCAATRHASACPRGRCRRARPRSSASAAAVSAASLDRPPERSIGIMPIAGKRYFVFHESMYSALPTKVMRRGTDIIKNAESRNEMWLGQRIAPPSGGKRCKPLDLHLPEHALDRRAEGADRRLASCRRRLQPCAKPKASGLEPRPSSWRLHRLFIARREVDTQERCSSGHALDLRRPLRRSRPAREGCRGRRRARRAPRRALVVDDWVTGPARVEPRVRDGPRRAA